MTTAHRTAFAIGSAHREFTSFLISHSTVVEVATCTLAHDCLTYLINECKHTPDSTLDETLAGELVVPVHCLIVKLFALRGDVAFEEKAVRFLRKLSTDQSEFFRVCVEKEAFGYNALELSVSLQLFSVAECILESSKYCSELTLLSGVKIQRVDLSEYDFATGERFNKSPLGMAAEMAVWDMTDPVKRFLDHRIISEWSQLFLRPFRRAWLLWLVVATIYKLLITIFGPACVYSAVTVESMSKYGNGSSCTLYPLHYNLHAVCMHPIVPIMLVLLTLVFMIENLSVMMLNVLYSFLTRKHRYWPNVKPTFAYFSDHAILRLTVLGLCIILGYYSSKSYPEQSFWDTSILDRSAKLRFLDCSGTMLYILTILGIAFDWMLLIDILALFWSVVGAFIIFMVIVLLVMALFCWLIAMVVPCDTSFNSYMNSNFIMNGLLPFYLLINNGGFSSDSVQALGLPYLVIHALIVLFCFNFLIALLSDRLSAAARDLRYICLTFELLVGHVMAFSFAFVMRKLGFTTVLPAALTAKHFSLFWEKAT